MLVILHTFFLHFHSVRVKNHTLKPTYTFGLGLISFFLVVILFLTGGLLMFFYLPSVERAIDAPKKCGPGDRLRVH